MKVKDFVKSVEPNASSLRSSPSLRSGHITADKREIKDFSKLPSATSFIRKSLGDMLLEG